MLTFDALLDEYFFHKEISDTTKIDYQCAVRQLVKGLEGQGISLPDEVTKYHVLTWRKDVRQRICQVSWNSYIRHLHALFELGIEQNVLTMTKNPFKKVKVTEPRKPKKTLNPEQISISRALIKDVIEREDSTGVRGPFTPAWFWQVVYEIVYYTGLRRKQLVSIQVRDVNLDEGIILARLEGSKTQREWKIPIVSELRPWMEKLMAEAEKLGFKDNDQLLNINRFSRFHRLKIMKVAQVSAFYRTLTRLVKSAISAHRFRHTLCTQLMEKPDSNLPRVKELMGHTSIATTMEYITVSMDSLRSCLEGR